jgi:hypothetical protein
MCGVHLLGLLNVLLAVAVAAHKFFSVTWCGKAFLRLRVQGVEILILVGASFLPSVAIASQQGFGVINSCSLLPHTSHDLGSCMYIILYALCIYFVIYTKNYL